MGGYLTLKGKELLRLMGGNFLGANLESKIQIDGLDGIIMILSVLCTMAGCCLL